MFDVGRDWRRFPELLNSELGEGLLVSPHFQLTEDFEALVVGVHDGDTVSLRVLERDFDFPLRLSGVDAPELSTGVDGEVARDWLAEQVLGKTVFVKLSEERVEKWGRLLGEVWIDGVSVGESMVQLGYSFPFVRRREGVIPDFESLPGVKQWV